MKQHLDEAVQLYESGMGFNETARTINKKYGLTKETGWFTEFIVRKEVLRRGLGRTINEAHRIYALRKRDGLV